MYCSNCGAEAEGNYCWNCGNPLQRPGSGSPTTRPAGASGPDGDGPPPLSPPSGVAPPPFPQNIASAPRPAESWHDEYRYDVLLHFEEVRRKIAAASARMTGPGLSAEQFLKLSDIAMKPLTGVSMSTVGSIAPALYARMGLKTGKTKSQHLPGRIGQVIVAGLCALALRSQELVAVEQGSDGCVLTAKIPSDFFSWEGKMVVTFARAAGERNSVEVGASTVIGGQLYDWGKQERYLKTFFENLQSEI